MANVSGAGTSWNCPNYTGELYLIGANQTPYDTASWLCSLQRAIFDAVLEVTTVPPPALPYLGNNPENLYSRGRQRQIVQ